MTKPRFKHDCDDANCCTFLGQTLKCDVYLVSKTAFGGPGLVMRRGSDGDDYSSFPKLEYARQVAEVCAETFHAVHMAEDKLEEIRLQRRQ